MTISCKTCVHWTKTSFSTKLEEKAKAGGYSMYEGYKTDGICSHLQFSDSVDISLNGGPEGATIDEIQTQEDFFCSDFDRKK